MYHTSMRGCPVLDGNCFQFVITEQCLLVAKIIERIKFLSRSPPYFWIGLCSSVVLSGDYKAVGDEWKTSQSAWWGLLQSFFHKTQWSMWLCTLQALLFSPLPIWSILILFLKSKSQSDVLGREFVSFC